MISKNVIFSNFRKIYWTTNGIKYFWLINLLIFSIWSWIWRNLRLDVLHVRSFIGEFWKTLNPHIFQTNNPEKLASVQMKELFKSFLMIYHKCQKTQFKKSTKTLKKKKSRASTKSHPQNSFGLEQKCSVFCFWSLRSEQPYESIRCHFSFIRFHKLSINSD